MNVDFNLREFFPVCTKSIKRETKSVKRDAKSFKPNKIVKFDNKINTWQLDYPRKLFVSFILHIIMTSLLALHRTDVFRIKKKPQGNWFQIIAGEGE